MNIRSGKRYSVEQIPQREHREGEVNPAQAASPTEALGDSCCGLLRGAVQLDLRCTLGPLELTFDMCPAGQETLQYRQAGGPGRRGSGPRESCG